MDARGNGTVGIFYGDAPQIAEAEGKRPRIFQGKIMKIVRVLGQEFTKAVVVFSSEELKESGAGFRDIDAALRLIVAQSFSRRDVVAAKPGISSNRGAIDVKGIDIGGNDG